MKPLRLVLILLALLPGLAQAVTCSSDTLPPSNPDSIYTDHGDGTVTDTRTGLMWKRCSEGKSWSGTGCINWEEVYSWKAALELAEATNFANHNDWRLPNLKELRSLVEACRYYPAINDVLFPDTPSWNFWSGTPYVGDPGSAWFVSFNEGTTGHDSSYSGNRAFTAHIRLVRGGQSIAPLPSSSIALTVALAGSGYGSVSSSNLSGIACYNPVPGTSYLVAPDCAENYSAGAAVVLAATAVNGSIFSGWSGGGCSGTGTCSVTLSTAQDVVASFSAAAYSVSTYGYFDTEYAGTNTLDFSARAAGFRYFNDSGQSGLLEVWLPNATSSATLEAYGETSSAKLTSPMFSPCGRGFATGAPVGKCALYWLTAGQQATVTVTDSAYAVATGQVQNPYAFVFHFYPNSFISASDLDWKRWAYQRAFLPWFDAKLKLLLGNASQIPADVAKTQTLLAVADLASAVAHAPMGVGNNLKQFYQGADAGADFVISQAGIPWYWTLGATDIDAAVSCARMAGGDASGCFINAFGDVVGAITSAVGTLDTVALNIKANPALLTRLILDEQLTAGRDWLSDTEVVSRAEAFSAQAKQNCTWGDEWFAACGLASDTAAVQTQYGKARTLMEQWIAWAKWSAGYFPNRMQELDKTDRLFGCAERKYATVLGTPQTETASYQNYLYRFYPGANLVIGTSGGRTFLYDANANIQDIGSVTERLASECDE